MQKEESFAKHSPCLWQLTLYLILTINKILRICAVARKPPGKEEIEIQNHQVYLMHNLVHKSRVIRREHRRGPLRRCCGS